LGNGSNPRAHFNECSNYFNFSETDGLHPKPDLVSRTKGAPRRILSLNPIELVVGRAKRVPYSWTVFNHFDKPDRSAISVHTPGMLIRQNV
jgi:hypothetical protein